MSEDQIDLGPHLDWMNMAYIFAKFSNEKINDLFNEIDNKNKLGLFSEEILDSNTFKYRIKLYNDVMSIIYNLDKLKILISKTKMFSRVLEDIKIDQTCRKIRFIRNKTEHFDVDIIQKNRSDSARRGFLLGYISFDDNKFVLRNGKIFLKSTDYSIVPFTNFHDRFIFDANELNRDILHTGRIGDIWYHGCNKILQFSECQYFASQSIQAIEAFYESFESSIKCLNENNEMLRYKIPATIIVKKTYDPPHPTEHSVASFVPIVKQSDISLAISNEVTP